MENLALKSFAETQSLITGDKHNEVPADRRAYLAGRLAGAGAELAQVVPVLIGQARSTEETAFIRDLLQEDDEEK